MKKEIHVLHLKINEGLRSKLKKFAKNNKKSMSLTIVNIVEKVFPFIEKNHISFQDKKSKYKLITNNKEKRYSILVYFPMDFYRKLKHIHHDLNFFSIAQIVRKIIIYYLNSVDKYGINDLRMKLKRIAEKWVCQKKLWKNKNDKFLIQLYKKIQNNYLQITYDLHSKPILYRFIN